MLAHKIQKNIKNINLAEIYQIFCCQMLKNSWAKVPSFNLQYATEVAADILFKQVLFYACKANSPIAKVINIWQKDLTIFWNQSRNSSQNTNSLK